MKNIIKYITLSSMLLFGTAAWADITTGKFSTAQMFDVQWGISGSTLTTSSYNYLYRSVPSSSRMTSSDYAAIDTAGQYFAFFDSTTDPGTFGMALYNSDGTQAEVIHNTGTFRALADGAIFYNGNGSWGTLITTAQGYDIGDGASFTIEEQNPSNTTMSTWEPDSTEPLADGETAAPAGPTYTSINNLITTVYPTSTNTPAGEEATKAVDGDTTTKYLNFDKESAGFTVKLSEGKVVKQLQFTTANDNELRDPSKFTLYGSNDGITWTVVAEDVAMNLPSARNTTGDVIEITNSTAYVYYYIVFPELKSTGDPMCDNPTTTAEIENCEAVQIAEVTFLMEDGDTTTSSDLGTGGVANPGSQTPLTSITSIQQAQVAAAFAITGGNNIDLTVIGDSNDVDITQLSNGNYLLMYLEGNSNVTDITQSGTDADRNFADINIVGSSNNLTMVQQGASNKTAFLDIDGSFGTYTITQQGTGLHHLDLTSIGDDATVTILQEGTGNHQAIVELENAGGNWNFDLTQSGDTNQLYSVPNDLSDNTVVSGVCTSGTCNLTVNQQ